MAERVLVAYDGSPLAEVALEHALESFPDASLTALYVVDPIESIYDVEVGGLPAAEGWTDEAEQEAEAALAAAREAAATRDVELGTEIRFGRPAREIVAYVDEQDVDHVVLGSHGRSGIDRAIVGSVAETVVRRVHVPVTVVG